MDALQMYHNLMKENPGFYMPHQSGPHQIPPQQTPATYIPSGHPPVSSFFLGGGGKFFLFSYNLYLKKINRKISDLFGTELYISIR